MTDETARPRRPYGTGRNALLAATISIVAERGLRGLTFRAVATEAGVANSLVAHHFGTRDELIAAAATWATTTVLATTNRDPAFFAADGYADRLVDLIEADLPTQMFLFEMMLEAGRTPALRPAVASLVGAFENAYREWLRSITSDRDTTGIAELVFAASDGIVLQHVALRDVKRTRAALDRLRTEVQAAFEARRRD